jgi:uncharacterized membrane protein YkoI
MRTRNLLVTAIVSMGLVASATAWAAEQPSEPVEMDSLPAEVQKTIKDKAAGGEVVGVKREDDKNGKWNYEATVKKEGKEWTVEIAPDGKFVKKHEDKAKD